MDVLCARNDGARAHQDRALVGRDLVAPVRSFHAVGIERNHIEQAAQTELFLQKKSRDFEFRKEQFRVDEK